VLTLVATPAALALRVWVARGAYRGGVWLIETLRRIRGAGGPRAYWRDRRLGRAVARAEVPEIVWEVANPPEPRPVPLRAAE
jgi:multidrug efflux pump